MALFSNKSTCTNCGAEISKDARFCGKCGAPQAAAGTRCGNCGTDNRADARFCKNCGQPMDASREPLYRHHWTRSAGEFAVRVDAEDLPGLLKRGLRVEQGTNAMLIVQGANRGLLPPGEYTLDTLAQRVGGWLTGELPNRATALLVEVAPTEMIFHLGGVFTADPLRIGLSVRLQAEVAEPGRFLTNLLRGRQRYTLDELRTYLYPEIVQLVERWVKKHTAKELAENYDLRNELELALEEALRTTFGQTGLRFLQIRALEFNLEHLDRLTGMVSKAVLIDQELEAQAMLAEAELSKIETEIAQQAEAEKRIGEVRQRLADAQTETERNALQAELEKLEKLTALRQESELRQAQARQDFEFRKEEIKHQGQLRYAQLERDQDLLQLAKELRQVEMEEQRVRMYERMRQAVQSNKMDEVRSEAELDRFLDELDREKLLRKQAREDMLKQWCEDGEDHARARAHLLAKLDIEQEYERRLIAVRRQFEEDKTRQDAEQELARKRADWEFELRRKTVDEELHLEQMRIRIQEEREQAEMKRQKAHLELQALQNAQERQDEWDDAQMGIKLLAQMKEVRRTDEQARLEIQRLDREENLRIQRVHTLEMARETQRLELEHMEAEERQRQSEREFTLRQKEIDQQAEAERLTLLAQMGHEALIAVSGAEQSRLLADLKKTEALKDLSAEQILARAAENSPEMAHALQEKFRALADGQMDEQERQMYERLLKQSQEGRDEMQRIQEERVRQAREDADRRARELGEAVERAHARGLDSTDRTVDALRDVASSFARQQPTNQPPVIINTPGQPPVIIPAGGSAPPPGGGPEGRPQSKNCKDCGKPVPFDARYCEHCGYEFPGV